tara:strand:- start:515 stop:799 length:285 start_codon:yes stop_codon:yes gene_type:complete
MGSGEVLSGIKNLKLERRQSNILKAEEKPWIAATVPPKRGNPLDWARYSDGKLTFWLDGHEQLAFVEYLAPFAHRKRNGGWWSDKPVVLIGVEQ